MYRIKYKQEDNKLISPNFITLDGIVISCIINKDNYITKVVNNKTGKILYKTTESSILYAQKYIRKLLKDELKLPIFEEARVKKHAKKKKLVKDLFKDI